MEFLFCKICDLQAVPSRNTVCPECRETEYLRHEKAENLACALQDLIKDVVNVWYMETVCEVKTEYSPEIFDEFVNQIKESLL